jgi:hypothetical protein
MHKGRLFQQVLLFFCAAIDAAINAIARAYSRRNCAIRLGFLATDERERKKAGILPACIIRSRRLVGVMTLAKPRPETLFRDKRY